MGEQGKLLHDREFKVVLIGSPCAKACMPRSLVWHKWQESRAVRLTERIDFHVDNITVTLDIWDTTSSCLDFQSSAAQGAAVIIMFYAIEDAKSFKDIDNWHLHLRLFNRETLDTAKLFLVGSKTNHRAERKITWEAGLEKATTLNALFFEASAESGLVELFRAVAEVCVRKEMKQPEQGTKLGQLEDLQQRLKQLIAQRREAEKERDRMRTERDMLQEEQSRINKRQEEIAAEMEEMPEERDRIKTELEAMELERDQLKAECDEMRTRIDQLKEELTRAQDEASSSNGEQSTDSYGEI